MLRILNLEAGYGSLRVLKGISLHVSPGEVVAIIGANGAGKTTLLKTVAGILKARSGTIVFDKREIHAAPAERVVQLGCSLVPEGRHVFSTLTVRENLILGGYCRGRKGRAGVAGEGSGGRDAGSPAGLVGTAHPTPGVVAGGEDSGGGRDARPLTGLVGTAHPTLPSADLEEVYRLFGILRERENQLAGTLSGGQQQMLAIGRALMARPRLLMMDEPSLGVAPLVVRDIYATIAGLKRGGLTILLVEQNARAALAVADRGYVIETGQIVLEGTAKELCNNREVQRAYLGKEYRRIDE